MLILVYLITGVLLAGAFLHFGVRRSPRGGYRMGIALLAAAFIYVAFAMASMESTWLLVELAGVVLFGCLVLLGFRRSVGWLALGWLLHVLWDVGLHTASGVDFVPVWYPIICVSFDLTVAGYIIRTVRAESGAERTSAPA